MASNHAKEIKMTHGRRTRIGLVCALALGLLAVPSIATAAKKPPVYKLTIKGSQVSTWTQQHVPQFDCDSYVVGNGSQDLAYKPWGKSVKVELIKPKRSPAVFALPGDEMAQYGLPSAIPLDVMAVREGEQRVDGPGPPCSGNLDGDQTLAEDCDPRNGRLELELGYGSSLDPAANGNTKQLTVGGTYQDFSPVPMPGDPGSGSGDPLDNTYLNCPFWAAGLSAGLDGLLPSSDRVPVGKLLRLEKGRSVKASGGERETYAETDFSGDTLHAWNLKLTRVK